MEEIVNSKNQKIVFSVESIFGFVPRAGRWSIEHKFRYNKWRSELTRSIQTH